MPSFRANSWIAGLLWITVLACPSPAQAGSLRLTDGTRLQGVISIQTNGVSCRTENGSNRVVALAQVAEVSFVAPVQKLPVSATNWHSRQVGAPRLEGSTVLTNDRITLFASGWGLWPSGDAVRVASATLAGDGSLVARVDSWGHSNVTMLAGITMRESLENTAAHASVMVGSTGRVAFVARGTNFTNVDAPPRMPNPWLRLVRHGESITGSISTNGREWEPLQSVWFPSGKKVEAGVFAAATINVSLGSARFSDLDLILGSSPLAARDLPAPACVLRDGSVIPGAWKATNDGFRISLNAGPEIFLPSDAVAAVLSSPVAHKLVCQPPVAQTGLVLQNGDWLEGEIGSITRDGLTLSSTLLGRTQYPWQDKTAAVVLAAVVPPINGWELELKSGSRIFLQDLRIEGERLVFNHALVGKHEFLAADLLALRRKPANGTVPLGASTGPRRLTTSPRP